MPKIVFFSPMILFNLIFLSLVIGFIVVIVKLAKKGKASAWEGELVDKLYRTNQDFDTQQVRQFYTLVFQTTEGKTIKVSTSKKVYDEYQIGDKAVKKPGELRPQRVG